MIFSFNKPDGLSEDTEDSIKSIISILGEWETAQFQAILNDVACQAYLNGVKSVLDSIDDSDRKWAGNLQKNYFPSNDDVEDSFSLGEN